MSNSDNVIKFPVKDDNAVIEETKPSIQEINKKRFAEGSDAWNRLCSHKYRKLSWDDRVTIALQIHKEILKLKVSPGKIAKKAQFVDDTKELYRLRLPHYSESKKRRLRAQATNYIKLIKAIAYFSGESISILANRITYGTSVHPGGAEDLKDAERIQIALQKIVNKVDEEFGLINQFRRIKELKIKYINQGDISNWPLYDLDILNVLEIPKEPVLADLNLKAKDLKSWGYKKSQEQYVKLKDIKTSAIHPDSISWIEGIIETYNNHLKLREQYLRGDFIFWEDDLQIPDGLSGLPIDTALPHLPHAYIGQIVEWSSWCGHSDQEREECQKKLMENYKTTPVVKFNKNTNVPYLDGEDNADIPHAWLAIYPDKNISSLIPVIIENWGDLGAINSYLNVRKINELNDYEIVGENKLSFLKRLKEMLGFYSNDFPILDEFRKTAPNLSLNPYFRKEKEERELEKKFQEKLDNFIKE